jgi:hypothetical protein
MRILYIGCPIYSNLDVIKKLHPENIGKMGKGGDPRNHRATHNEPQVET